MNRRLKNYAGSDKELLLKIRRQADTNEELIKFLETCLLDEIEHNVFAGTDGYIRGVSDGKAEQANEFFNLIRSLGYDQ